MTSGGVEFDSIRELARAWGKVPTTLRRELRPAMRRAGEELRGDMRKRASYSSRIPSAIRMTTSFSARGGGVKFRVDARRAPHARVLERGNMRGRATHFRHPVFGDKETWVTQPTRPFFFPALVAGRARMKEQIRGAVRTSLREVTR